MLKKCILILVILINNLSFTQVTQNLDSLKANYKKNPKNLDNVSLLAQYYEASDIDSASFYAKKLLVLSKNNFDFSSRAYNTLANCELVKNNLDEAIKNYNKAIEFSTKGKLTFNQAVYSASVAQIYLNKGEIRKAIEKYNQSLSLLVKERDKKKSQFYIATVYGGLGDSYNFLGLYDIALQNLFKSLDINQKIKDPISIAINYNSIASIYNNLNQIEKSKNYNLKALTEFNKVDYPLGKGTVYFNLSENYFKLNQIETCLKNLEKAKNIILKTGTEYNLGNIYQLYGEINIKKEKYEQAIEYYNKAINIHKKSGATMYYGQSLVGLGTCFFNLNQNKKAKEKLLQALHLFDKEKLQKDKKETLEKLISFSLKDEPKSVVENYFKLYRKTETEYLNDETQKSIVSQEIKYKTEIKEAKIKTQQLQIQKEKINKYIAFSGIGLLLLILGGSYFWFRNKQKQSNLKTQNTLLGLQQNLMKAELSNLNKQLDPHEIKNLLASISPEIQEKAPESYKKMLKLFNLTKASLNSNSITDSIKNQLQQIDDFLSLEKSMLPIPLEYSIETNIQNEQIQIPRLLLKNLVENSLKHGIKQQETGGSINVKIEERVNFIYISVDDTGKGRKQVISLDSGIGTSTYRKLFETLNRKNKENATFEIIDKQQGTKVEVKIPINYKYN